MKKKKPVFRSMDKRVKKPKKKINFLEFIKTVIEWIKYCYFVSIEKVKELIEWTKYYYYIFVEKVKKLYCKYFV